LAAAVAAGALAVVGLVALHDDAHYVYHRLTSNALPLVIVSAVAGIAVLVLLWRERPRGTRPLAVLALAAVVWGWGVAQHPYLLPKQLKISQAAAPSDTLTAILIVFGAALVLVIPSFVLLYTLAQRSMIEETPSPPATPTPTP
jgi:cytochrome d ubiquinol oxidase subunit II